MILTNVISGNSPTFSIGLGPGAGGGGTGGGLGQDGVKSAARICKLCTWCGLVLGGDRRLTDRGRMKGKVWSEMTSSSARGSLVAVVWWAEDGAGPRCPVPGEQLSTGRDSEHSTQQRAASHFGIVDCEHSMLTA